MKKNYIIYGVIAIIIIAGFYVWNTETSSMANEGISSPETTNSQTEASTTVSGTSTLPAFTLTDVQKHNDATSCYSAINGNVYDLTSWIDKHPGGRLKILMICGRDGSTAFNLVHGGKARQATILATFKIGTLTQ